MKLSIIMAYHNEGKSFVIETMDSIRDTIDISDYEVLIVDDGSDMGLNNIRGAHILRHPVNQGVGTAFDSGVKYAKSDNIFLMGCDVRFTKNNWASKMVKEIETHKNSLICTSVVNLSQSLFETAKTLPDNFPNKNDMFNLAKSMSKIDLYRGASILFFIGDDESPHHIIEAQWLPREFLPLRRPDYIAPKQCYEIPCILGAAYGTTNKWYNHIDGFWGHHFWGTLEPYISLKSWLMGGKCFVAPHIETAHIFNETGVHASQYNYGLYKSYNRMLVASLLFPQDEAKRLIQWLPDKDFVNDARMQIACYSKEISKKRLEYQKKFKITMEEFVRKQDEILINLTKLK